DYYCQVWYSINKNVVF
nr:immunoglobulin light chain junction region [Macaca mulatta]MOY05689.1 immunoglobulin light chain junction region [Macaca mulatta]MOY06231.1 immunoglobulin light chain junction region [Macaca mulatta]MOY06658.1 immunoglobulin light chain junction region [Macaca mulatta]MOY06667.1 immunoglobulin light chain junction region [Macaca mulatta]